MSPPEGPLNRTLAELDGAWLDLGGCCQWIVNYPIRLMAEQQGRKRRLRDVLPLLKCKRCGGKPTSIALIDDPQSWAPGRPPSAGGRVAC